MWPGRRICLELPQPVHCRTELCAEPEGVFAGLINTYKAMGGGWVTEAEATANEVDYPPPESKTVSEESKGAAGEGTTATGS